MAASTQVSDQSFLQQTAGGGAPATSSAGCRAAAPSQPQPVNDLKVGIGLYGNFGLAMDYGNAGPVATWSITRP